MAQNVGTPRFWVDILQWLKAQGQLTQAPHTGGMITDDGTQTDGVIYNDFIDLVGINPTNQLSFPNGVGENDLLRFQSSIAFNSIMPMDKNFSMVLGHNLGINSAHSSYKASLVDGGIDQQSGDYHTITGVEYLNNGINDEDGTTNGVIDHDGFSILVGNDGQVATSCNQLAFRFDSQTGNEVNPYNSNPLKIGSLLYGSYYDMSHSPDLNLKLSYEYDGVKTIQTKGGTTLSNASYTKPADWGESGAWQLGTNVSNFRSGRRVWDLSFSYLSDTDVMPNLGVQNYEDDGFGSIIITEDILTSTDFFSQVWNKTMGGHLPFIFQPDGANADPKADGFAICRFDMKSLTYNQVAKNIYNVKLKIKESW